MTPVLDNGYEIERHFNRTYGQVVNVAPDAVQLGILLCDHINFAMLEEWIEKQLGEGDYWIVKIQLDAIWELLAARRLAHDRASNLAFSLPRTKALRLYAKYDPAAFKSKCAWMKERDPLDAARQYARAIEKAYA